MERRDSRFNEIENRYADYRVQDRDQVEVGKVEEIFLDERDEPEYIGLRTNSSGLKITLIPMGAVLINERERTAEIMADAEMIKAGPSFDEDREITPEFERLVRGYYGLETTDLSEDRGLFTDYPGNEEYGFAANSQEYGGEYRAERGIEHEAERQTAGSVGPGMRMGDTESGEFREHDPALEGAHEPEDDLTDEDELRVQRSEEELKAATRERETGRIRVRKRVKTERESIEVPTRHEEVRVERVPVEGEASEAEIGDDEIRIPVVEEEVIVEKRPVKKEEIRIRKETVEGIEAVEEDVRREEVEVVDENARNTREEE